MLRTNYAPIRKDLAMFQGPQPCTAAASRRAWGLIDVPALHILVNTGIFTSLFPAMKDVEYGRMFDVEDHHWWYLGMETITRAILDRHLPPASGRMILDAGCGTGAAMANYLPDYGAVTGFDISSLALGLCRVRKLTRLAQASVMEIPFASGCFDLVASFDVMVIVDRDTRTLEEFFRVLRPGGHLLLRVAAYDWLRGEHDITVRTAHRYTVPEVHRLLRDAGFKTVHLTYANTLLFPLAAGKRLLERLWPPEPDASDLTFAQGALDGIFRQVLASEAPLASRTGLPFGLSIFALARKPAAVLLPQSPKNRGILTKVQGS